MRLLKLVPDNTNLRFVSRPRKWAFGLTMLLTIAAVALVGARMASTWASTSSAA